MRFTPTCVGITRFCPGLVPANSVHPHVRGDHAVAAGVGACAAGSPPRAWGSRQAQRRSNPAARFTPTCVGITTPRPFAPGSAAVHPHVRGDHSRQAAIQSTYCGSPPRAWGSLRSGNRYAIGARFTPTCVGITEKMAWMINPMSVHPHVRGDHERIGRAVGGARGSPPRAWGSPARTERRAKFGRFTPTCVGITMAQLQSEDVGTVHPHVRGDHIDTVESSTNSYGSPPRAWGSQRRRHHRFFARRFTPTCVGITPRQRFVCITSSVHPHVRGDHASAGRRKGRGGGSPPRAWGSPRLPPSAKVVSRFTPTCVGITSLRCSGAWMKPVHPHVRGDHVDLDIALGHKDGSPPRAWGSRSAVCDPSDTARFTPTCVGITAKAAPRYSA